jgi:hypothetical protein
MIVSAATLARHGRDHGNAVPAINAFDDLPLRALDHCPDRAAAAVKGIKR